nr:holo-ACP synthase [Desulfobacterales bacterium]
MIYGIGIDLVNIRRIEKALRRWGSRFQKRVFTPLEIRFCKKNPARSTARFALCFAAKEAFSKALGTGIRKGVAWRQIEVLHEPSGRPYLQLNGHAKRLCEAYGIKNSFVTLSDDGRYAAAMVVLEE